MRPERGDTMSRVYILAFVASLAFAVPVFAQAPQTSAPRKTGYVLANGIRYYYEIHGRGEPLLLLHGGLGSIGMFEPGLPELAREREVIAVDLHGHGRTALGNRPINLVDMGNDLGVLLDSLKYRQVDVMGYSM